MSTKPCPGAFWQPGSLASGGGYVAVCSSCGKASSVHPETRWQPFAHWLRAKIEAHRGRFTPEDAAAADAALRAAEEAGQTGEPARSVRVPPT